MDVVAALAAIRDKGLTAEADALEAAIDETLCDQPIVRIAGGLTADQIAEKVVEKLKSEVQERLPDGVPPVPWRVAPGGDSGYSADDRLVLDDSDFLTTPVFQDGEASPSATIHAIVEAVNAYFAPAEASTEVPESEGGAS